MKWRALSRKTSPVDERPGLAHYLENPRLGVDGEMRRRRGMAKGQFVSSGGAIIAIIPANPSGNNFVGYLIDGGSVEGDAGQNAWWGDVVPMNPTGTAVQRSGVGDGQSGTNSTVGISYSGGLNLSAVQTYGSAGVGAVFVPPRVNSGGINGHTYTVVMTWNLNVTLGASTIDPSDQALGYVPGCRVQISMFGNSSSGLSASGGTILYSSLISSALDVLVQLPDSSTTNLTGTATWVVNANKAIPPLTVSVGAVNTIGLFGTSNAGYLDSQFTMTGTLTFAGSQVGATGGDTWDLTVLRASAWEDSYAVYARDGAYPIDENDANATFISTLAILPASTNATYVATMANSNTTWKFIAVPKRNGVFGPPARLV